jgi:hypothetical protein
MTKPPVVVVEVGQCKISDRPLSRNAARAFDGGVAVRGWHAAVNSEAARAKSSTLTGGFEDTILAGYFKRQRRKARGWPWKGPG